MVYSNNCHKNKIRCKQISLPVANTAKILFQKSLPKDAWMVRRQLTEYIRSLLILYNSSVLLSVVFPLKMRIVNKRAGCYSKARTTNQAFEKLHLHLHFYLWALIRDITYRLLKSPTS